MSIDGSRDTDLETILRRLRTGDTPQRIRSLVELQSRNERNAPVEALLTVGRCLSDKSEFDPNPDCYAPVKYVPKVSVCAAECVSELVRNSPFGVEELLRGLPDLTIKDRNVAIDVLGFAKESLLCETWSHIEAEGEDGAQDIGVALLEREAYGLLKRLTGTDHQEDLGEHFGGLAAQEADSFFYAAAHATQLERAKRLEEALAELARLRRLAAGNQRREQIANVWFARVEDLLAPLDEDDVSNWGQERMKAALTENPWRVLDAVVQVDKLPDSFDRALLETSPDDFKMWIERLGGREDVRGRFLEEHCRRGFDGEVRKLAIIACTIVGMAWIGAGVAALWGYVWALGGLGVLGIFTLAVVGDVGGSASTWLRLASTAFGRNVYARTRRRKMTTYVLLFSLLVGAMVAGMFGLTHYRATHPFATFQRWGLSFEHPWSWKEAKREEITAMKRFYTEEQAARLVHLTMFETPQDVAVLVAVEMREPDVSFEQAMDARTRQIREAQEAGNVTKLYALRRITVDSRPAALVEVEHLGLGRARDIHVMYDQYWVGVSLIQPTGKVAEVEDSFERIVNSLAFASD